MQKRCVLLCLGAYSAAGAELRLKGPQVTGSITWTEEDGLSLKATRCVDRSNLCGHHADAACKPAASATVSSIKI